MKEEENFGGCERTVTEYVRKRKKELGITKPKGYVPLEHKPGEAQVDFGECENYIENGVKYAGAHLVMTFPYSNERLSQLTYGQSFECLAESMVAIFEKIGGVPKYIVFDNASTIVATIGKNVDSREMTERFERFALHYNFEPIFANPASGWEKGSVERGVGYTRKNIFVPVPRFTDIHVYNRDVVLSKCDAINKKGHYIKDDPIEDLFEKDLEALLPLPSTPFETTTYTTANTDKCGLFKLDNGWSIYSSSPDLASSTVRLKITGTSVTVMDNENHEIVTHRRIFGDKKKKRHRKSIIWGPYLDLIGRKPRAWFQSGFAEMAPDCLNDFLKKISNSDRGKIIRIISKITKEESFDTAISFICEALDLGCYDHEGIVKLYKKFFPDKETDSDAVATTMEEKNADEIDLSQYDDLL